MNRSLLVSMLLRGLLLLAASVAWAVHAQAPASMPTALGATAPAERAVRPTVMLLLPAQSTAFALPAEALREGFFAAHKASGDDIAIQVVELDDSADQLGVALASARDRGVGIVVGPLPRAAVTDIVEGQRAGLPLLALNFPESDGAAPATMCAMALSVEAEAQRIARLALSEFVGVRTADTRPRIAVVTRTGGIERRIAQAYVSALRSQGEVPQLVEWTPATAGKVAAQLATPTLEAVFLALTARDAAQMRALIPRQAQIFGTSLLYVGDPRTSPDAATLAHDLEGVRFVDMPWLLEPDHAGVMVYPAPANALPTELVRLYALGIDAYRLATIWMKGERRFDLDGVTGRLHVDRAKSLRVERRPVLAIYRGGAVQRIDVAR